ncbi:MAG: DmsE family decaheme c-type cytochrome, partial [Pseudomonadota bacterium]
MCTWRWRIIGARLVPLLMLALLSGSGFAQDEPEAEEIPYSRDGADTCLACHDDAATLAMFKNPHGRPSNAHGPFGQGQLQCEACHGPGGLHSRRVRRGRERPPVIEFGSDKATPVAQQNAQCATCHESSLGAGWHSGAHNSDEIACADCHSNHVRHDPVLVRVTQTGVCTSCHLELRLSEVQPYGHLADGQLACTDCHGVHDAAGPADLVRHTANQTCYQCHAEKRGPFLWEHAPVVEDCMSCHTPHGSMHPGMLERRGPLACQS